MLDLFHTVVRATFLLIAGVTLLFASALAAAAREEPHRVLVLHSFRSTLPVNTDWTSGIMRGFARAPELRVEVDVEAPNLSRFSDPNYVNNLLDLYRRKYQDPNNKPHLLIPTYTPAFEFLLMYGEALFPGVPIVFLGADAGVVAARKLASHVTGIISRRDVAGTLELALHVHPDTQHAAMIVGSGDVDKAFERDARQAIQPYENKIKVKWLQGLPHAELLEAVRKLPPLTVILYLVQLQDRNGKSYAPINTVEALSSASMAPLYGLWDTLLGHGIIGGRLATLEEDGFRAAQMGMRILTGEAPAAIPVVDRKENSAIVHGGELARRNIGEDRLPAGTRIRDRQRSIWALYGTEILVAGLVIGLQGLLILALVMNRATLRRSQAALRGEYARRAQAETDLLKSGVRLAKFSRERNLGVMATTIAHEISQPLIAIQNYAQAATRRVAGDGNQAAKLTELIEKIEGQAGRAGDIIQRIRTLVSTDRAMLNPISLNSAIEATIAIMRPEFESQECSVGFSPAAGLPAVLGDALQIQLVLVNLIRNALQAMEFKERSADRIVRIEVNAIDGSEVEVSVADRGSGVPSDALEDIFEPLYSGRGDGMGMGLAVCRTILEAHGGRIWCAPNPSGGAIFRFTLRLAAG